MTRNGGIKTKMYEWRLALSTLYKIEDHQDLWVIIFFMKMKD